MKKIIDTILKNRVIQNIMKMMTGTMIGQVISVVMVPITSRIYGAELYGDLAVFTSASSICTSVLGFGLASAIMVEKTDQEAMQTYKLAVNMTNALVFVIMVVALLLSPYVQFINSSLPYVIILPMLAFYVMTTNQINMLYAWLNRNGRYDVLLMNPIIAPVVNNGLAIILGLLSYTSFGLFAGLIIGQFITLIHMFAHMDKISYKFRIRDFKTIVKRNRDFIMYQYPANFMNTIVGNLPIQLLSFCFGNTVVGYYSMAMKLLNIPSNIISNSVSRVYFKEATEKERSSEGGRDYTFKACRIITSIYCIPVAVILLLGGWLIPFFLGADWAPSVEYIQIMCIWNLFAIAINSTSGFTSVIGRQRSNMIISIVKLIVFPISMLGISMAFQSPTLTIWTYAIAYSIINVVYYEVLLREDKNYKNKYIKMSCFFGVICAAIYILGQLLAFN